jgi:hypothetical protein
VAEQIARIEEKRYSFEEAVKRAAEQNVARNFRQGLSRYSSLSEMAINDRVVQYHLARTILLREGQNTLPEYPDTEHVCVKKEGYSNEKST